MQHIPPPPPRADSRGAAWRIWSFWGSFLQSADGWKPNASGAKRAAAPPSSLSMAMRKDFRHPARPSAARRGKSPTRRSRSSTIRPRFTALHAGVVPTMPPP